MEYARIDSFTCNSENHTAKNQVFIKAPLQSAIKYEFSKLPNTYEANVPRRMRHEPPRINANASAISG